MKKGEIRLYYKGQLEECRPYHNVYGRKQIMNEWRAKYNHGRFETCYVHILPYVDVRMINDYDGTNSYKNHLKEKTLLK